MSEQVNDYDAGDKEAVNNARKKAARIRASRLRFVAAAMEHEEGRAWFYELLDEGHIFTNPFLGEDTHGTAFNLGEQNFAKKILAWIMDAAPEKYLPMLEENKQLEEGNENG